MTAILGISAYFHDSAAALIIDGVVVAAAQEERFSRRKHDASFPSQSIEYCLDQASIEIADLDYAVFYEKPFRKFERLLETFLQYAPWGYRSFRQAIPIWLKQKIHVRRQLLEELGSCFQGRLLFTDHHESHAASAFFPSPFESAAILTIDGVGEWSTTCIGVGNKNSIQLTHEIRFPHSLGLLYSAFTHYCGFRVNSGEYKLMGLAPFGNPIYKDLILKHLIDLKPDGSFRLDMSYFDYCSGLTMTSRKFHRLFGGPSRNHESELTVKVMDIAASIQQVLEEVLFRLARELQRTSGQKRLVAAGGVALNGAAFGKLLNEGLFEEIWIQPAAGDAGGALGAAWFVWHQLLQKPREKIHSDVQQGSLLGPEYSQSVIEDRLNSLGAIYQRVESEEQLCESIAELLEAGKVVGRFQGRMEYGPRALGSRSILGDARHPQMQSVLNQKVKFRESFRPFAPIVLRERAQEYFDLQANHESPYMSFVVPVRNSRLDRTEDLNAEERLSLLHKSRSSIPAVTHIDGSARLQTVDQKRFPLLHQLLSEFNERTGCPVLINTSFNVRGEPIVCTPDDAWNCFMKTEMDVLAIGNCILLKENQCTEEENR